MPAPLSLVGAQVLFRYERLDIRHGGGGDVAAFVLDGPDDESGLEIVQGDSHREPQKGSPLHPAERAILDLVLDHLAECTTPERPSGTLGRCQSVIETGLEGLRRQVFPHRVPPNRR